jgi:hypothetical protein
VKDAQTSLQKIIFRQKNPRKGGRMGKNIYKTWVFAREAKNTYPNKACKQSHYV